MKKLLFMLTISALFFTACKDEYELPPNPKLEVNATNLKFGNQAGSQEISVVSNLTWIVESNADWCIVTPSSADGDATLKIEVLENTDTINRTAIVLVKADKTILNRSFTVEQLTGEPQITVSPKIKTFNYAGGVFDVDVIANIKYDIILPTETWVIGKTPRSLKTDKLTFEVFENTTQNARSAKIIFKERGGDIADTLTIEQEGIYDALLGPAVYHYKSVSGATDQAKDIKIDLDYTKEHSVVISGILDQPLYGSVEILDDRFVLVFDFPQGGGNKSIKLPDGTERPFDVIYTPDFYDESNNIIITPTIPRQLTASTKRDNISITLDNSDYGIAEAYDFDGVWVKTDLSSTPGSITIEKKVE